MCFDCVFVLFLLVCGVFFGSWYKFVEVRGFEYFVVEVKLDRVVGICWCFVEVSGKLGGYRDKFVGKGGIFVDGIRIFGDGVKRFGVKFIIFVVGGSDWYVMGSVFGSVGLDFGL